MKTKNEIEEQLFKFQPELCGKYDRGFMDALEWVLEGKKYKPIEAGNSYGIEFLCPNCDFPKDETLLWRDKYCWNCGCELDWSEWEEK